MLRKSSIYFSSWADCRCWSFQSGLNTTAKSYYSEKKKKSSQLCDTFLKPPGLWNSSQISSSLFTGTIWKINHEKLKMPKVGTAVQEPNKIFSPSVGGWR